MYLVAEVPVSPEAHACPGGGGGKLDATTACLRRRRTCRSCEEAGDEHVDSANHRLFAVASSSSSAAAAAAPCDAAFCTAAARLGPPIDRPALSPCGSVAAEAPGHAARSCAAAAAVVGCPAPYFLASPIHEGASTCIYAGNSWDSLRGNADGTGEISCSTGRRCYAVPSLHAPLSTSEQETTRFPAPTTGTTVK